MRSSLHAHRTEVGRDIRGCCVHAQIMKCSDGCVRFGMQSIYDSTVPAHFAFHAFNMQPHGSILMHDGGIFCRQELAFSASQSSETQSSTMQRLVLATHRNLLDMAIPLTRANRLAAMHEGVMKELLTPFLRGPLHFTYSLDTKIHMDRSSPRALWAS